MQRQNRTVIDSMNQPEKEFHARLDAGKEVYFKAQGDSMTPLYAPGTIFVLKACEQSDYLPGDIVLVRDGERWLLHRLLERREGDAGTRWLTKGDRLDAPDPIWPEMAIRAKATAVKRGERFVSLQSAKQRAVAVSIARISPLAGRLIQVLRRVRERFRL